MKNVGGGGVVQDDDLGEVPTQAAQVLDVITPVEDAGLAEQATTESPPLVQEVRDGVGVLQPQTGRLIGAALAGEGRRGGCGLSFSPWLNWR